MQTFENIPKNPEHVDNVPKRPENPDCNVQKVYPKSRHVPVWLCKGVTPPPPPTAMYVTLTFLNLRGRCEMILMKPLHDIAKSMQWYATSKKVNNAICRYFGLKLLLII